MPKFAYKAKNSEGAIIEGVGEAATKFALAHDLHSEGVELLTASEVLEKKGFLSRLTLFGNFFGKISMHDKIMFARNLATMLDAGLAISRALAIMAKQTNNKKLKKTLDTINDDIKKGVSLRDSMKKFPKVFSALFVSMVAAGEESGKLSDSLRIVASQTEKTYLLQKKIKGAMIYPSVIIFAMLVVGIFMLIYIVPTLTATFRELNIELPATTQVIIGLSDFIQNHFIVGIIGLVLLIVLIITGTKTALGKKIFDHVIIKIPLIASLYKQTLAARTTRTLSSLLSSGVPVLQALTIVEETISNTLFKQVLQKAAKHIQVGMPMSTVFSEATHLYPIFVGEMMAVGEETGELGHMLLNIAEFYEAEVDQKTKDLSTVVEPVLMIIVGAAVGFFAISMISPMYSIVEKI